MTRRPMVETRYTPGPRRRRPLGYDSIGVLVLLATLVLGGCMYAAFGHHVSPAERHNPVQPYQ